MTEPAEYVNKAALLEDRSLPEDDVEVPGFGLVRVRGLSRDEMLSLKSPTPARKGTGRTTPKKKVGDQIKVVERRMIALGLVHPSMTEAEVGRWMKQSIANEMDGISKRISELSGMSETAAKEAFEDFEDEESDDSFPVLPS